MTKFDNVMRIFRGIVFLSLCISCIIASAQLPSDLSMVKAAQISDSQLQEYINKAKASGLTPEELETELLRRGLPSSEMAELKLRMQQLVATSETPDASTDLSTKNDATNKRTAPRIMQQYESLESIKNVRGSLARSFSLIQTSLLSRTCACLLLKTISLDLMTN